MQRLRKEGLDVPGVVAVGFEPAAFVHGQRTVPMFPELDRDALATLVDLVGEGLGIYGDIVVIYPRWADEPTVQRLRTVRNALDTNRLLGYASPAPPLAGAVLTALASAIAATVPAGLLLPALPVLERQLLAVTWLAKVSGLEHPAPSLLQHVQSWLPRSAFAVTSWPRPAVTRLTRQDGRVPLPRPRQQVGLAVADSGGDPAWVRDVVAPALGAPHVVTVPASRAAARWWGTARVTEAVVYPLDIAATAAALTSGLRPSRCAWCHQEVAGTTCPYCALPTVGPLGLAVPRPDDEPAGPEAGALIAGDAAPVTAGAEP